MSVGARSVVIALLLVSVMASGYPDRGGSARAESAAPSIEVHPVRCQFAPGETAAVRVVVTNPAPRDIRGELTVTITRLADEAFESRADIAVAASSSLTREFTWTPPPEVAGYGVHAAFRERLDGAPLVQASTAFDVARTWTQAPRYGFLCDFEPGRADGGVADAMNRYHINAVQFYDWMYRHDTLLPETDEFVDSMGRRLSIRTVRARIEAVKRLGMAALAYVTVYAASPEFFEAHEDWALWEGVGRPCKFGDGYLYLMNPAAGSPWRSRMMAEYQAAVSGMGFDGVHIDQYGYPKLAFAARTCEPTALLRLGDVFADFVDEAKSAVARVRPGGYVVFNCVNNWPVEAVAPSHEDIEYIEVWPPHDTYADIVELISGARRLGSGKAVVLAAYLSPARHASVRYLDAVIFAAGGGHIELGEGDGMLTDPYFPRHERVPPALASALRRYYDFCTRYMDLLYVGVGEPEWGMPVSTPGYPCTSLDSAAGEVWFIPRRKGDLTVLNLVNLLNVRAPLWNADHDAPPRLDDVKVRVDLPKPLDEVWFASPEFEDGRMVRLDFAGTGGVAAGYSYEIVIPRLEYWSMVVLRQAGDDAPDPTNGKESTRNAG